MKDLTIPTSIQQAHLEGSLEDVAGQLGKSSRRIYQIDAAVFASWMIERGLTPQTLTRSNMIAYRSYLQAKYAKTTANRRFVVARRILAEQVYQGKIGANPATDIKGFKVDNETTHRVLSEQEAQDLLDSINTSTLLGKRDYTLILLLIRTGMRRAEAAALTHNDIREEQGHHIAIIAHGKGDKRRIAKLPVDVWREITSYIEALRTRHALTMMRKIEALGDNKSLDARREIEAKLIISGNDPLFVSFRRYDNPTRRPMGDKAIETQVKAYAEKLGIGLTPHGLRATFITLALENDAKLQQVQYAVGHSDPRTTERYQGRKINLDDNAVDYVKVKKRR